MNGQGLVKGILIEGRDGHEYLLGVSATHPAPTPTLSRRGADGRFEPIEDVREASRLAARQLGLGPTLIGPGWGSHLFLWAAFKHALSALPTPPAWPRWRS